MRLIVNMRQKMAVLYTQRWARYSFAGIKVSLIFAAICYVCWHTLDPDFGWHLQAGNYMRQHGVPAFDVFTYTAPSFPWIDHEWASDIVVSWLYQAGGYGLLTAVFAAVWTAAICLFRDRLRLGILLIATTALLSYMAIRPVAWTVLGMAVLLWLVGNASRTKSLTQPFWRVKNAWRTQWVWLAIPLLFLVWANMHGGFVSGLAVVGYMVCKYRTRRWLLVFVASTAVTVINPYGLQLYVEIIRTLFDPALHTRVSEWQSFHLSSKTWPFIGLWLVGFAAFARRRSQWFGLAPIFLAASLSATRNLPLFVVVALHDLDGYARQFARLPAQWRKPLQCLIGGVMAVLLLIIGIYVVGNLQLIGDREAPYPRQAVAYLQAHPCPGEVFNSYNYGGYLIWKLPGTPVYIDGRMPSWRDAAGASYMERYESILKNPALRRAEFARFNIRCAVLAGDQAPMINDLRREGWSVVAKDSNSVLLVAKR